MNPPGPKDRLISQLPSEPPCTSIPYQSLPSTRTPRRAIIYILIAWTSLLVPICLFTLGPGLQKNIRNYFDFAIPLIRQHTSLSHHVAWKLAILVPNFIQCAIILPLTILAILALRGNTKRNTISTGIIRTASIVAILWAVLPLLAVIYIAIIVD